MLIIHQNFGHLNLQMFITFIILFTIDLYKENRVRGPVNVGL